MKKESGFFLSFNHTFRLLAGLWISALSLSSSPVLADSKSDGGSARMAVQSGAVLPIGQKPSALNEVGITEKLGDTVSINDLKFQNEAGEVVPLASFFQSGKPVVLSLSYYNCPGLCGVVLNALLDSMKGLDWVLGNQYEAVNVSIDHKEGSALALEKKDSYLKALGKPGSEKGWHFLTGTEENIKKLTQEVGFGFKWVPEENQYAHGAAVYVLTPEGKISRILYGIQYKSSDLKLSLLEASNGKIGTILDRLILF